MLEQRWPGVGCAFRELQRGCADDGRHRSERARQHHVSRVGRAGPREPAAGAHRSRGVRHCGAAGRGRLAFRISVTRDQRLLRLRGVLRKEATVAIDGLTLPELHLAVSQKAVALAAESRAAFRVSTMSAREPRTGWEFGVAAYGLYRPSQLDFEAGLVARRRLGVWVPQLELGFSPSTAGALRVYAHRAARPGSRSVPLGERFEFEVAVRAGARLTRLRQHRGTTRTSERNAYRRPRQPLAGSRGLVRGARAGGARAGPGGHLGTLIEHTLNDVGLWSRGRFRLAGGLRLGWRL